MAHIFRDAQPLREPEHRHSRAAATVGFSAVEDRLHHRFLKVPVEETVMEERMDVPVAGMESATSQGRTIIADLVVAKIAGLAAKEIEGVHELVTSVGETIAGFAQRVTRADTRGQGVRVALEDGSGRVDLRIITDYGVSIVQVADAIRRNIINRVKAMTGIDIREVNIEVTDLYFPQQEEREEMEAQERRVA
jgi:uncharacterized alkaline shock family protein YloU